MTLHICIFTREGHSLLAFRHKDTESFSLRNLKDLVLMKFPYQFTSKEQTELTLQCFFDLTPVEGDYELADYVRMFPQAVQNGEIRITAKIVNDFSLKDETPISSTKERKVHSESMEKNKSNQKLKARQQAYKSVLELATTQFNCGLPKNACKNFTKSLGLAFEGCEDIKASTEMCIGFLEAAQGNLDSAVERFQKALEQFFEINGVKSEQTGCVTSNIGAVFIELDDLLQALEFQKSAKTIVENLDNTEILQASINYNLGIIHFKLGNHNIALEIFKKSLEDYLAIYGENDVRVSDIFHYIADTLWKMRIFQDSMEFLEKAHCIYKDSYGPDHLKCAAVLDKKAIYYLEQGQLPEEAENLFRQSLRIKMALPSNHAVVADAYYNLGKCYLAMNCSSKAILNLEASVGSFSNYIKTIRQHPKSDNSMSILQKIWSKFSKCFHLLIVQIYNDGDYEKCLKLISDFEKAMPKEMMVKNFKGVILGLRSMCYLFLNVLDKSYNYALQNLDYHKAELGEGNLKTIECFFRLGYICKAGKKEDEAIIYAMRAIELAETAGLQEHPNYQKYKSQLADLS